MKLPAPRPHPSSLARRPGEGPTLPGVASPRGEFSQLVPSPTVSGKNKAALLAKLRG
jgi:hypothetical protein